MPFGIVGRTGPGMRQAVGFWDRSTERGTFGANLGRAIVTNGDFTAYMYDSAATRPSSHITLGKLVNLQSVIGTLPCFLLSCKASSDSALSLFLLDTKFADNAAAT